MRSLVDGDEDTLLAECLENHQVENLVNAKVDEGPSEHETLTQSIGSNCYPTTGELNEMDQMRYEDHRLTDIQIMEALAVCTADVVDSSAKPSIEEAEQTQTVFACNYTPVEISNHRRIRKNRLSSAKRATLAAAKARFGTCNMTSANIKAVHRFVYNLLNKHGVQEGQMCHVIPFVVNAVFIPNKYELEAAQMYTSAWAQFRRWSMPQLGGHA